MNFSTAVSFPKEILLPREFGEAEKGRSGSVCCTKPAVRRVLI